MIDDEYPVEVSLTLLRRIMNRIHENGDIFYDRFTALHGRYDAYARVAILASDIRHKSLNPP